MNNSNVFYSAKNNSNVFSPPSNNTNVSNKLSLGLNVQVFLDKTYDEVTLTQIKQLLESKNYGYSTKIEIDQIAKNIYELKHNVYKAIYEILTNKKLKNSFNNYISTLSKENSDYYYYIYKIVTSKTILHSIPDFYFDERITYKYMLLYISKSKPNIPYCAIIYYYLYITIYDSINIVHNNPSVVFLSNKNVEQSEFYNEFLQDIDLKDFSSILEHFENFDLLSKNTSSNSIVFSAFLKPIATREMNIIRYTRNFFDRKVFFKVYPKGLFNVDQLYTEKNIYEQLYKLVKYNVTPNIISKVATSELSNFYTNFVTKLNKTFSDSMKQQIKDINDIAKLKENSFMWETTNIIMTQPGGATFKSVFLDLSSEDKKKVLFQMLYTLYVFEKIEFSHGDLHHNNIFIVDIPETELSYLVEGTFFRFKTTRLVKIYDFDQSIICNDTNIKYNRTNETVIRKIKNPIREETGWASRIGLSNIFNKNTDKIKFFLQLSNNYKNLDKDVTGFINRNFPGIDSSSSINQEEIHKSYELTDFTEPNRIYDITINDVKNIDKYGIQFLNTDWGFYFRGLSPPYDSPRRQLPRNIKNNQMWIPDNVIFTTIEMLKDTYFQELHSLLTDINVRKEIIYTIDNRIII